MADSQHFTILVIKTVIGNSDAKLNGFSQIALSIHDI